jgi:hypothetical protein
MTEIFRNFQLCAPRSREPRIGDCGTKARSIACYHVYTSLKQQYLNLSWSMSMDAISKMSNFLPSKIVIFQMKISQQPHMVFPLPMAMQRVKSHVVIFCAMGERLFPRTR